MGIRNYTGRGRQSVFLTASRQIRTACAAEMGHHLPTNSLLPWERRPITIREDGDVGNGKGMKRMGFGARNMSMAEAGGSWPFGEGNHRVGGDILNAFQGKAGEIISTT